MVEWAFEDSITEPARWQYLAEWGKVHQKALGSLLYPQVLHLWIQPIEGDGKYFGEKFHKVPKNKT